MTEKHFCDSCGKEMCEKDKESDCWAHQVWRKRISGKEFCSECDEVYKEKKEEFERRFLTLRRLKGKKL